VEAAGVDLPRSSHSRMISRRRWAQSARNDRKPWCGYKSGTGNLPASALFRHHPLNVRVLTCRTGQRSNAGEEARSSRTAALGQLHRSTHPRKVVFMRTRSGISPIGISRLDQRPSAPLSQPGASVTWSQCSVTSRPSPASSRMRTPRRCGSDRRGPSARPWPPTTSLPKPYGR
jgi:hypothetical protein